MDDYQEQIDEMKQMINNIALHVAYNHPGEAVRLLNSLALRAQDLKDELDK